MASVTVRRAQPRDVENIAREEALYIDCPWTAEQIREETERDGSAFFVAEADGDFAGYLSGTVACDECEISTSAVCEKYRRRGAGYALFSALIAEVKARGVKSVFLLVRSDNAAAIALYGKCGFIKVGERPRYYKGKDALIMRLNL